MDDISGKIALVTGASRGIGRAAAIALAKSGVDVAVNFKTRYQEAEAVCSQIEALGRRSIPIGGDVSIAGDVSRIMRTVMPADLKERKTSHRHGILVTPIDLWARPFTSNLGFLSGFCGVFRGGLSHKLTVH